MGCHPENWCHHGTSATKEAEIRGNLMAQWGDNGNIIGGEGNFITITSDSNIFDLSIKHFGLRPMNHG
jgi:hypothetical protein